MYNFYYISNKSLPKSIKDNFYSINDSMNVNFGSTKYGFEKNRYLKKTK